MSSYEHIDSELLVSYAAEVGLLEAAHTFNAFIMDEAGVLDAAQPYLDNRYKEARLKNEANSNYQTDNKPYQITTADYGRISLKAWGCGSGTSRVEQ